MSSDGGPAVVDRVERNKKGKGGLWKRIKKAATPRSSKEELRGESTLTRLPSFLRRSSFSSAAANSSAQSTPHAGDSTPVKQGKDTFAKAPSGLISKVTDEPAATESPYSTPRGDLAAASPDASPKLAGGEQSLNAPSTPPSPERRPRTPALSTITASGDTQTSPLASGIQGQASDKALSSPGDEQQSAELSAAGGPQESSQSNRGTKQVDGDSDAASQSGASCDTVKLASHEEDVPGGGTVLPFGKSSGQLEGYTTLQDPQDDADWEMVEKEQDPPRASGKPVRALLAVMIAVAAGAAGVYISSHPAVRPGHRRTEKKRTLKEPQQYLGIPQVDAQSGK